MINDTIAAISTSISESGIGIIRISGPDAFKAADAVFVSAKEDFSLEKAKTHTIHFGHIMDGNQMIDEVLVSVMRGPRSYTGEDVCEINCHGGIYVLQRTLELVLKQGVRCAEPGEFTKRAFLNGRMDLSEAEAVMDLIKARSEDALKASAMQLSGSVSRVIEELRGEILHETAFIEAALDDPEHYDTEGYPEQLSEKVEALSLRLQKLIENADNGRLKKEGIKTVLLGNPNVGKSSLLNRITGQDKAIVTEEAGTTRDVLTEEVLIGGVLFLLMDTAGIRNTENRVEKIGVDRAMACAKDADLILYVVNLCEPFEKPEEELTSVLREKKVLFLINKADLQETEGSRESFESWAKELIDRNNNDTSVRIIFVSALTGEGVDNIGKTAEEMSFSGEIKKNEEVVITSSRHKEALLQAERALQLVQGSIEMGMTEEFFSLDLMNAYKELGKIIGKEVGEDLVNEIFSSFCMGK